MYSKPVGRKVQEHRSTEGRVGPTQSQPLGQPASAPDPETSDWADWITTIAMAPIQGTRAERACFCTLSTTTDRYEVLQCTGRRQ